MKAWSRFTKAVQRNLGLKYEEPTPEMYAEVDRLDFSHDWIRNIVRSHGLEFGQLCLSNASENSHRFERWYPELRDFAETKRRINPLPSVEQLSTLDSAIYRILKPKILDSENVLYRGHFIATILTAPLCVLPVVIETKRDAFPYPIFLTPDELREWQGIYEKQVPEYDDWWYVFQDWDAVLRPSSDKTGLPGSPSDLAQLLVTWGVLWELLGGYGEEELWGVSSDGQETFIRHFESWVS